MGSKNGSVISRREFARRAAFVSAAASLSSAGLLASKSPVRADPLLQTPAGPKLSPESQTEMESRLQAVLAQYGSPPQYEPKKELHKGVPLGRSAAARA